MATVGEEGLGDLRGVKALFRDSFRRGLSPSQWSGLATGRPRPRRPTPPIVRAAQAAARALGFSAGLAEASSDANVPMSLGIPAVAIGGGGQSYDSHTAGEWCDSRGSCLGTQHALLVVALAQP